MNKDLISGVVLLAVAGLYYHFIGDIADSTLSDEVGATGLPVMLAVILAILAVLLIGRSLVIAQPRAAVAAGDGEEERPRVPRALGFLLFGVAYIALIPFVGYVIAVALLIAAIALYEGAPRNWVIPAAAIGGALIYWAVFVKLLGVHQPVGTLIQGLMP